MFNRAICFCVKRTLLREKQRGGSGSAGRYSRARCPPPRYPQHASFGDPYTNRHPSKNQGGILAETHSLPSQAIKFIR